MFMLLDLHLVKQNTEFITYHVVVEIMIGSSASKIQNKKVRGDEMHYCFIEKSSKLEPTLNI